MGIWQDRLNALCNSTASLPRVAEHLRLGHLTQWRHGYIEKVWSFDPLFSTGEGTPHQVLFGGYVAALADQALAFAAMSVLEDGLMFRTAELQLSFFRALREGEVRIEGHVLHASRRAIQVQADFLDVGGRLCARASATQLVMPFAELSLAANEQPT
jgi:uncharacterized protein (TIGR00369 family)